MTKTAQELTDGCNSAAPQSSAGLKIITQAEYNQVIDGLRMQLHLLCKQGERARKMGEFWHTQYQSIRNDLESCHAAATGATHSPESNCDTVRLVRMLHESVATKDASIDDLKGQIENMHALFKNEQSKLRKKAQASLRILRNRHHTHS